MKTPKEKAKELVEFHNSYSTKDCIRLLVSEIMKCCDTRMKTEGMPIMQYWDEVKQELNKLYYEMQ